MEDIFDQSEGWEQVSIYSGSPNTQTYILRSYFIKENELISQLYAFKVIAICPPVTSKLISSQSISFKYKDFTQIQSQIKAYQRLNKYKCITLLHQIVLEDDNQSTVQFFRKFLKKKDKKGRYIGLLTEYCPFGTLKKYIQKKIKLTIPQVIIFSLQIAECLTKLKAEGILHRDINSHNILFSCEGLKLTDFDCAFLKNYSSQQNLSINVREEISAPQLMDLLRLNQSQKTEVSPQQLYEKQQKCDIYSFGTVIFEMFTGHQFNQSEKKHYLCDEKGELKELILKMLESQRKKRISIEQIYIILNKLAKQYNIEFKQRGIRQYQTVPFRIPQMIIHPSTLSKSKSNSLSLSDWSLQEISFIHQPTQPLKTPTQYTSSVSHFHKPTHHFTINQ